MTLCPFQPYQAQTAKQMSGIMYAILGLDMDFCTYAVSNGSMELPTIAITRKAEPLLVSPLRSVSASENWVGYMIDIKNDMPIMA